MRIYRAIAGKETHTSGFIHCLLWSQSKLEEFELVIIEKQLAGEKYAHRVAEVTSEGVRLIRNGSVRRVSRVEVK